MDKPKKACVRCKRTFRPKRRHARFCGPKCASAERSKRYRAKHSLPLVAESDLCPVCKDPILRVIGNGGSPKRYCSEDCKRTAEKLRGCDEEKRDE